MASKPTKNSTNSKHPSSALRTKPFSIISSKPTSFSTPNVETNRQLLICGAINQGRKQKQSSIVNIDGEIITSSPDFASRSMASTGMVGMPTSGRDT